MVVGLSSNFSVLELHTSSQGDGIGQLPGHQLMDLFNTNPDLPDNLYLSLHFFIYILGNLLAVSVLNEKSTQQQIIYM